MRTCSLAAVALVLLALAASGHSSNVGSANSAVLIDESNPSPLAVGDFLEAAAPASNPSAMPLADFLKTASETTEALDGMNIMQEKDLEKKQAARGRRETDGTMCMDDEFENNNSYENATLITDVPSEAELKFCPDDARDYYRFDDICSGGTLDITVSFTHADGDLDIFLYSDPDTFVAASTSVDDVEQVFARGGGTYYLVVANFGGSNNTYSIDYTVDCMPCADDALEPNGLSSQATPIDSVSPDSQLTICEGDQDYFSVDVCPSGRIDVEISFSHYRGNLNMAIANSQLSVVATATSTTDNERLVGTLTGGRYYIIVYGSSGAINSYTISYSDNCADTTPSPCVDDEFEPNNNVGSATHVDDTTPESQFQVCSGDADVFAIDVCERGSVVFEILFSHAQGDLNMIVYNSDLEAVTTATSMTDNEGVAGSLLGGRYYIVVLGSGGAQNSYTVAYSIDCPCVNDEFEDNDHPVRATPINDITPETQLQICEGDLDVFALDVCDGGVFDVTLSFDSNEGNLEMTLIDGSYAFVAATRSGPPSGDGEYLRFTRGGVYYLLVGSSSGEDEVSYTLNYTVDCNPGPDVCVDDDFEFNNHPSRATPATSIMPDTPLQLCANDPDFYVFEDVCEGGELVVDVSFESADGDLYAQIFDTSMELGVGETVEGGKRASAVSETGGTMYLAISSILGTNSENSYTLSYSIECPPCTGVNPIMFQRRCRRKCNGFYNYYTDAEDAGFTDCHKPHCECLADPCEGASTVSNRRMCNRRCKGFFEYVDAEEAGFPGCNKKVCNCLANPCEGTNPVRKEKFCRNKCNNNYEYYRNAENAGFTGCNRRHCVCL